MPPTKNKKNLHPQKNWKRLISGHFCESPLKGDTSLAFFLPGFCSHLQQAEFRTSGCCYNRQTLPARFLGGAKPLEITGGWVLTSEARDVSCNRKLHQKQRKIHPSFGLRPRHGNKGEQSYGDNREFHIRLSPCYYWLGDTGFPSC